MRTIGVVRWMLALAALAVSANGAPAASQVQPPERLLPINITVQNSGTWAFAVAADESIYATSDGSQIGIFDAASGRKLRDLVGHSEWVGYLGVSPDGRHVASTSIDKTLRFWDVETGEQLWKRDLPGDYGFFSYGPVRFSADGRHVLFARTETGAFSIFDAATGDELSVVVPHDLDPTGVTYGLAAATQDNTVAWAHGGKVWVADAGTGEIRRTIVVSLTDDIDRLAMSADGHVIALTQNGGGVRRFDAITGKEIGAAVAAEGLADIALSPDGKTLATSTAQGVLTRYNATKGTEIDEVAMRHGLGRGLFFGADGTTLRAYGSDLFHWNFVDGTTGPEPSVPLIGPTNLHYASDDSITFTSSKGIFTWSTATGIGDRTAAYGPEALEFEPGLISTDGRLWLRLEMDDAGHRNSWQAYDPMTRRILHTEKLQADINQIAFSPDGSLLAVQSAPSVIIWDTSTWQAVGTVVAAQDDYVDMFFSADNQLLAKQGSGGRVTLVKPRSGLLLQSFGDPLTQADAFSPAGDLVATSTHREKTEVFETASGKSLWTQREQTQVARQKFSADGKYLLIAGYDGVVTVRSAADGSVVASVDTHSTVIEMDLSPYGQRLTTFGSGAIRLFDLGTSTPLATSYFFADGEWVTMTPEGFFAASANGASYINAARGLTVYSADQIYQAMYRPDLVAEKLRGDRDGKVVAAAAALDLRQVLDSGRAPKVVVTSPSTGTGSGSESVDVAIAVTDQGGGIGKIEWRVNGVTLGVETRGFDRLTQAAGPEPVAMTRSLSLDPGDNLIEVVAYNEKGLIASDPASVTISWDAESASTPPKLYVVSVGVNDYFDSRLELTYAASDARAVAAGFEKAAGSLYESVEVTTVLDSDVTASRLDALFTELGARIRPRDVFVLFMAGHGKTQDGRYYFLPADFRYVDESSIASGGIGQDRFQEWLARIPARKSMLLYDTCDSGSLTNGAVSRGLEEVAALSRMTRAVGRTVLSASTDDAPALEGYYGHGVFTYALLDALGSGDANGDGTIEVTELASAVDRSVPEISYATFNLRQIPQMSIVGSDFPITQKVAVLEGAPEIIAVQPTHIITAAAEIRASAPDGEVVGQLAAGTAVRVIEDGAQWALVARNGQRLGYVAAEKLLLIQ